MGYVICEPCTGCVDTACVDVCPCDCIHGPLTLEEVRAIPKEERAVRLPGIQLFIDPDACIDCGACASECPSQAIFAPGDVPVGWHGYVEKNATFFAKRLQRE